MRQQNNNQIPLPNGFKLQSYEILEELGRGGFAITYLALDTGTNKPVAIKEYFPNSIAFRSGEQIAVSCMSTDKVDDFANGLERFKKEAITLGGFKHPNIIKVYSYFEANSTAYFIMEYIEGQSLENYAKGKNRALSEDELITQCLPILKGLKEVHAKKLLHLDIKPDNIIQTKHGEPMLIDFGGAKVAVGRSSQEYSSMVATPGYAPLEQYTVEKKQTSATDIYAFGMTLYRLIAPQATFPTAQDRQMEMLENNPDPLKSIQKVAPSYSKAIYQTIEACTQIKQKQRPQSIDEVQALLSALVPKLMPELKPTSEPKSTPELKPTSEPKSNQTKEQQRQIINKLDDVQDSDYNDEKPVHTDNIRKIITSHDDNSNGTETPGSRAFFNAMVTINFSTSIFIGASGIFIRDSGIFIGDSRGLQSGIQLFGILFLIGILGFVSIIFNSKANRKRQRQTTNQFNQRQTTNQFGMEFIQIPAGRFQMGDIQGGGGSGEKPVHWVNIDTFHMSKTEVTQGQWQAVMGNNPSRFKEGVNYPVERVSWNDVQTYIKKLNKLTGITYRLPSEAQWEYAARAGSTSKYSWGNSIGNNHANCDGCGSQRDGKQTAPVASFAPNAFGLYDMHGNVWEWTQDCWNDNYSDAPTDGSAWESGDCAGRVLRGGSWSDDPKGLRSANRGWDATTNRGSDEGFRLIQDRNP